MNYKTNSLGRAPAAPLFSWRWTLGLLVVTGVVSGCAKPKSPPPPAKFNFATLHRISVMPFDGPGSQAVTNAMIKQLLTQGFEVVDPLSQADAVLKGTVTDYKTADTLMVFLGTTEIQLPQGQKSTMDNPILSFNGSQVTVENAAMNLPTSQVVAMHTTVGVTATLMKPHSNEQLWVSEAMYEALDISQATDTVTNALAQVLHRVVTTAMKRDS